ncbi:MAG TPA: YebC/PmpR family DNA-binding transcriptional regulator [Candidatus Saccharimonadia bacterium]|jgi:YebC/PmpR family DNA-binding regulatory protein|nr:YebC/PmpR family DNA-binding transcriptional regulator [Candidatus Saccharimonadia bacterium]
MSGHSKWASIKHQKGIKDARRGASFTKFANLISVAARGGADPDANFKLRLAVDMARKSGVPNANIERAIKRGSGQDDGTAFEEITYEGYGPGGAAIIVETATDNRNRTAPDVRSAFTKHGGSLGTPGSVAYQFTQRGVVVINATDMDTATMDAIEAGAEDVEEGEGQLVVYTKPTDLDVVRKGLSAKGYEVEKAELSLEANTTVEITDEATARKLVKLIDALDELDDVTNTHVNFDIAPDLMDRLG